MMQGYFQRFARLLVAGFAAHAPLAAAFAEAGTEAGQCDFDNVPIGVGYYWDPTCKDGMLGCDADGRNMACRFCGSNDFQSVPCPASSCKFPNDPFVSYYWDTECTMGKPGCWADGVHEQCRFCGGYPFTNISCPEHAAQPNAAVCAFKDEPDVPHYWEPGCVMGKAGCNADGVNVQCRFCGEGVYSVIPCPAEQVCQFKQRPTVPFFWDPDCKDGGLGCKADGMHNECRFCATRPFESIPCPEHVAPPANSCTWPALGEPHTPYFWDPTCKMGEVGCWADGVHAECRFCGHGVYRSVACPNTTTTTTGGRRLLLQVEEKEQAAAAAAARAAAASAAAVPTAELSDKEKAQSAERAAKMHEDWFYGDEKPLSGADGGIPCIAVIMFCTAALLALSA